MTYWSWISLLILVVLVSQKDTNAFRSVRQAGITDKCAADFLFIIDGSSSVRDEFRPQTQYVLEIVKHLTVRPDAHRVALIQFSSARKMRTEFGFDTYMDRDKIEGAIRDLPHMTGITETAKALEMANKVLQDRRRNIPTFVVVVTDGLARYDPTTAAQNIHQLVRVHTFCVGLGDQVDKKEIQKIASDSKSAFYGAKSITTLMKAFKPYLDCATVPTITTTSRRTTEPVRPDTPRGRTSPVTFPQPLVTWPQTKTTTVRIKPGDCVLDLLIILDASGSEQRSFDHELEHAVEYVDSLKIGEADAKVALVRFSSKTKQFVDFDFNTYSDKDVIVKKLKKSRFLSGTTRLDLALMRALEVANDPKYGRRRGTAKLITIVLTDGYTQREQLVAPIAAKLRAESDQLIVVGVTPGTPHYGLLDIIAGKKDGSYTVDRSPTHFDFGEEWRQYTAKCR